MFNIGPMTDGLLEMFIYEVNKKDTREKILKKVIDPLLYELSCRYYPYFIMITIILILIIVLLLAILVIMMIRKNTPVN